MERKDLLLANAQIFSAQGKALNAVAHANVKVLVVGNPANTNALIARANAPRAEPAQFHRDDAPRPQPRALAAGRENRHSRERHPPHDHLGQPLGHAVPGPVTRRSTASRPEAWWTQKWIEQSFIPVVQQRGAAVIKARGSSSAASAASAAIDHVHTWVHGTAEGNWVSMAVPSDGSYGIPAGVIYSYPVTVKNGDYQIVPGLSVDEFSRKRMDASHAELLEERDGVKDLLG